MLDTFAPSSPAAPSAPPMDMADLLVAYLEQLGIEYAFGIPGGAIEPLYNALARSDDTRAPVADYTTFDLTLRHQKAFGNCDVRATVLNVFNRDAREPSFAPGNIPYDIPLPRRAFNVELSYRM